MEEQPNPQRKDKMADERTPPTQSRLDLPPPVPATARKREGGEDKINRSDLIMIVATIFIAFGTIVSAGAICFQWYEMHIGGADTTKIANAAESMEGSAEKSAQAARDFADTAKEIDGGISDAVGKLDKQATAAQRSADAVVSANRAWIVPDSPPQDKPTIEAANLIWHNAGKTPAVAIYSWKEYFSGELPPRLRNCADMEKEVRKKSSDLRQYQAFVAENGKYEVGLDHAPTWFRQQPLSIHGCIWYTDISSNTEKSSEFFYVAFQNKFGFPSSNGISVFFARPFRFK